MDGTGCSLTNITDVTDANSILFAASASNVIDDYNFASFWFRYSDDATENVSFVPADITFATQDAADGTEDNTTVVAASNVPGAPAGFAEDTWYYVKDVAIPVGTDGADTHVAIALSTSGLDTADVDDLYIDQVRLYNEKIELDIASDGDLDRTFNNGTTNNVVSATLKDGSTTVATGYVDIVPINAEAAGAAGIGTEDAFDGASGVITFIPTSTQGTIEIAKGTTKTYTVNFNSTNLLGDDAGVDDPVTFTMDYGSSASGTVTNGDFFWYETNTLANGNAVTGSGTAGTAGVSVRWQGNVSGTSLTGNTVKY